LYRFDHYYKFYERTDGFMVKYFILLKNLKPWLYGRNQLFDFVRTMVMDLDNGPNNHWVFSCFEYHSMFGSLSTLTHVHWIINSFWGFHFNKWYIFKYSIGFSFSQKYLWKNIFIKFSTLNKIIISVKWVEIAHCLSFPSLWVLWQKLSMLVHV
jgi:hypothetical protein